MTIYYVSSIIGSNTNAGTSATTPLASLQAAEALVKPGDTVEIMNGTYTAPPGGNVLTITTSGTSTAPITFEAYAGATPVIYSAGDWHGIEIDANWIIIKGLTVEGNAENYTLAQALAGYTTGDPTFNGDGIAVGADAQTTGFHNIIIENNTVFNEGGAGISVIGADYVQVLNNYVHDNAHWSAFGASGISFYKLINSDTLPGVHIVVEGNTSVNNAQLVPTVGGSTITDGEGIILDTNPNFVGKWLVENNTTSGNSGPGVEALESNNVTITGNNLTGDLTNKGLVGEGEIYNNSSSNITATNNITTVVPPTPPPGELVLNGSFETHDFAGWTVSGNSQPVAGTGTPQLFMTAATADVEDGTYALAFGSYNTDAAITQTFADKAGESYTFSFWLANDGAGNNDFTASWDGQAVKAFVNAGTQGYTHYTFQETGTGSDTIQFSGFNNPGAWYLDNVQVTDNGTSNGTSPPPPPPSDNLVANGGFETGDFTGWTLGGNDASPQIVITSASHNGNYAAEIGSVGSDGTLSQNLTTVAGQSYTFDFWLQNGGGTPNDFTAKIGGVTEMHLVNAAAHGYTEYQFNFTATGTSTPIEFDAQQNPTEWHLDDVSVTPGAATSGLTVVAPPSGAATLTNPTGTTSDILIGQGSGVDTFALPGSTFGNDVIEDFRTSGSNHDVIDFSHTVFARFKAVIADAAQVGSNTVITLDANDTVTLVGVTKSHLQAADFHFV